MSTERCLTETTVYFQLIIPVAPGTLSPVILSFSVDSQWKKATPEFFEGVTGGAPPKSCAEGE